MTRYAFAMGLGVLAVVGTVSVAGAQERAAGMFGNSPSRNMVSDETGLPSSWDTSTGENVLWSQPVGSQAYGGAVVAEGRVYVGTNNEGRRNPSIDGDKGVVMVFDAGSGEFLWQMAHDKLTTGRVNDWPLQGVCSTAYMEGGASTTSRTEPMSSVSMPKDSKTAKTTVPRPMRRIRPISPVTSFGHTT